MADDREAHDGDAASEEPLPPRAPRPFVVHWAVATAVVFLATVILLWFFLGVPILFVIIGSAAVGLAVAPYSSGNEERALAERRRKFEASQNGDEPDASPDSEGDVS